MTSRRRRVLLALALALLASAAGVWWGYTRDLREARAASTSGSRIAGTRCGPIEYASAGEGPLVLVVHGTGGGHDQGMLLAPAIVANGHRVVAMSRFGYLRTPVPRDASPAAQADAHACLLDALGTARAAIIGVSAGALSATEFAIRHPERCSALILLVPLAWQPGAGAGSSAEIPFALRVAIGALESDFVFWALLELAPQFITSTLLATPPGLEAAGDPAERERVDSLRRHLLPVSTRAAGLRIDARNAASLQRHALETIRAPTLVISLADDRFDTYASARHAAREIRGARFVGYPTGGHVWVGRQDDVMAQVTTFLAAWSAASERGR